MLYKLSILMLILLSSCVAWYCRIYKALMDRRIGLC